MQGRTILVIDDEIGVTGSLQQKAFLRNYERLPYGFVFESCLAASGYSVALAIAVVEREPDVSIVLLDLKYGPAADLLGFEILRALTSRFSGLPVLVLSSMDRDVETLSRCLEEGAVGFLEKHRSPEYLQAAVERAIQLMESHVLLGQSEPMKELRRQAARLSPYDQIPVLVVGERGTGKERVARYIHQSGPRRGGPFVPVNCAGVPESLFEAEFFGNEKGAYTGADHRRAGYLERAHGGVLFLDEVGTLPVGMQSKLLRVLQERTFQRLGAGAGELMSSFQLVSATNVEPARLLSEEKLREDFYDRIAAVTIRTPPLRECAEDIPLLAAHFLRSLVGDQKVLSEDVLRELAHYSWPGNVRELQRVLQEGVVRSEGSRVVDVRHLSDRVLASDRRGPISAGSGLRGSCAPLAWSTERLRTELTLCLEAKRIVKGYKGRYWKAEFMRRVYPHCKASSAKGFNDLIRRLTQAPWGDPNAREDEQLAALLRDLESD